MLPRDTIPGRGAGGHTEETDHLATPTTIAETLQTLKVRQTLTHRHTHPGRGKVSPNVRQTLTHKHTHPGRGKSVPKSGRHSHTNTHTQVAALEGQIEEKDRLAIAIAETRQMLKVMKKREREKKRRAKRPE